MARVAASEARPLLLLTRNEASLEPIHKGLWGFARTVRLEELSVVIFFMSSTSNSGGVSFCRCELKIFWAFIFPIIVSSFFVEVDGCHSVVLALGSIVFVPMCYVLLHSS